MKRTIILLTLAVAIFLLNGCELPAIQMEGEPSTVSTDPTSGEKRGIEDFSENEFETNKYMFSEISAVTLYQNGTAQPLETNDPRIIRLLNFLSFVVSSGEMISLQGHPDAEWMETMTSYENYLEIDFNTDYMREHSSDIKACVKLIVNKSWCTCVYLVDDSTELGIAYEPGKQAMSFNPYPHVRWEERLDLLKEANIIQ